MLGMPSRSEVDSPTTDDATPPPIQVDRLALPCTHPTVAGVLAWIAAGQKPWFPSQFATETGTDRDALDDPLSQLRLAGLVHIVTWVRGLGQGYTLTTEGEAALASGTVILSSAENPAELASGVLAMPGEVPAAEAEATQPSRPSSLELNHRTPLVGRLFLLANLLWFFVGLVAAWWSGVSPWSYMSEANLPILHRIGSVTGDDLVRGEWWRLLGSCFVHADGLHLLVNLIGLAVVGPLAELLWGRTRLFIIYLLSGLAGSCLAMALNPDVVLVGASGAIWGVLMSLLAWLVLYGDRLPPKIAADSMRRVGLAIVLNAGLSLVPGISWEGHLGGALAGFVTAGLLNVLWLERNRRWLFALALLVMVPIASLGGLGVAMKWGEGWAPSRQRAASREKLEREHANEAAAAEPLANFTQNVVPLLDTLRPDMLEGLQVQAVTQLSRPGPRPGAGAVRSKVAGLKVNADTIIGHLAGPATDVPWLDAPRTQAKVFAEARSHSFALLLEMLNAPGVPNAAALAAWNAACKQADAEFGALLPALMRLRTHQ